MPDVKIYDKIVYRRIEDIIPYENNARINDRAIKALEKTIPAFGFNVPIVIDKNNVIIKGHSRYEALKALGYEALPCIVSDDSEEDAAEERLVDNKTSELAQWDAEKMNMELRELNINLRELDIDVPAIRNGVNQVADVTSQDIERAKHNLSDRIMITAEKQDLIEVHCESCGETFFVNYDEVKKYADE